MGFLSDLTARSAIAAQGKDLARQFAKRLPRERIEDEKRVAAEFEILVGNALGYQRRANLGFYGKSSLVNNLQWALIEGGYPQEFAKRIGSELAMKLAATA